MAASVAEAIYARVAAALTNATSAGARVERDREDPYAAEDAPALNVRRTNTNDEPVGQNGARQTVLFDIDCHVSGAAGWATVVDALHMEVHTVLAADSQLAVLGHGLRCTGTEVQGDRADRVIGKLTAHYQMQVFVRPHDLTRSIN